MKKILFSIICCMLAVIGSQAETVTYTVASTSSVNVSGTAPDGATATFSQTYNTKCQMTKNNSMTLTLNGYTGCKITGITLSMKSNSSKGSGSFEAKVGTTTISSIETAAFNSESWNGSYTTSYVDVTPDVTAYEVNDGEELTLTIAATVNSLYCQSFTITYSPVGTAEDDTTPVLKADVDALKFTTTPGSTATVQTIELTTNEYTGAVSYVCDNVAFAVTDNGDNTYNVTYTAPETEETTTGSLTFSANGVEDVVVDLTGVSTNSVFDVLNREFTTISGTNYAEWSDKTGVSGAVYAGKSAGGNDAIQLRSKNSESGIVTTTTGGIVKSVTVTWNESTVDGRTMDVYGKNTPYSTAADLYDDASKGTKLGSIVCDESTSLTIEGNYTYIGLRSNDGAMYITDITIEWFVPYEENIISNKCYAVAVGNEWDEAEGCWYAAKFINKNTDAYTWASKPTKDDTYNSYIFYLAAGNTPIMRAKAEDAGYTYTHVEFVQLPAEVAMPANIQELDLTGVTYKTTGELYYDGATSTTYDLLSGEWKDLATGIEGVEVAEGIAYANGVVSAEGAIEVYNIGGAVVARGNDNVDLNGLNGGVYIVRNGDNVRKVVR